MCSGSEAVKAPCANNFIYTFFIFFFSLKTEQEKEKGEGEVHFQIFLHTEPFQTPLRRGQEVLSKDYPSKP